MILLMCEILIMKINENINILNNNVYVIIIL